MSQSRPLTTSNADPFVFHTRSLSATAKITVGLEIVLASGALVCGTMLFLSPDGTSMRMPTSLLRYSGFTSFRVPGAILFVVNGLFPLISAAAVLRRNALAPATVVAVGVLLSGWIGVQVLLLRAFSAPLHGSYFVLGLVLVLLGAILRRQAAVSARSGAIS